MFRTILKQISRDISRLQLINQCPVASRTHHYVFRQLSCTSKNVHDDIVPRISEAMSISSPGNSDDFPAAPNEPVNVKGGLMSHQTAIEILQNELFLSKQAGEKIFQKEPKLRYLNGTNFRQVVKLVTTYGIDSETVKEFPWILAVQSFNLRSKLDTLIQMKPKRIDDFIPLLRTSSFRLLKILCIMDNERDFMPEGNRIYYLSNRLNLPPATVSKYIASRLFMLEIPPQMLMSSLEIMLDYGISPTSIIRDLWAFRYNPQSIQERLERAKRAHKVKVMPWMIRCPESILQKSLRLAADEQKILGENGDVYDYISKRLGFDYQTTKSIVAKHPAVARIRVMKIKEVLDYLLDEIGCTNYDIAQAPRILSHSLQTTKRRLDELKSYGCVPSSLVIVCKSKREYQKFLNKWIERRDKMKLV